MAVSCTTEGNEGKSKVEGTFEGASVPCVAGVLCVAGVVSAGKAEDDELPPSANGRRHTESRMRVARTTSECLAVLLGKHMSDCVELSATPKGSNIREFNISAIVK